MLFREAVSKRIMELSIEYSISINNLAELSSIPPTTFRDLLYGNVNNPSSYLIYKICRTLDIDIKDFFDSDLFYIDFDD